MMTFPRLLNQVVASAALRLLAAGLAVGLASCGGPAKPEAGAPAATLPANAEARDSVKEALNTPALDATSTSADSSAARNSVTPR